MYYPETAMLWEAQAVLRGLEFDLPQKENKGEMGKGMESLGEGRRGEES